MGKAIPYAIREQIVQRRQGGESLMALAEEFGFSYAGVCKIWRQYRSEGQPALVAKYSNCGRTASYDESFQSRVKAYRLNEGARKVGAPYIRSKLLASKQHARVPHERTIQRWFREAGINRPVGRGPKKETHYSVIVHETWQADAKENLRLADGSEAC